MISLHIKALEQLYKLAPSQSSPFSPPGAGLELPGSACWGWAASSEGLEPLAAAAALKALCCSEVESAAFSPNRAPHPHPAMPTVAFHFKLAPSHGLTFACSQLSITCRLILHSASHPGLFFLEKPFYL